MHLLWTQKPQSHASWSNMDGGVLTEGQEHCYGLPITPEVHVLDNEVPESWCWKQSSKSAHLGSTYTKIEMIQRWAWPAKLWWSVHSLGARPLWMEQSCHCRHKLVTAEGDSNKRINGNSSLSSRVTPMWSKAGRHSQVQPSILDFPGSRAGNPINYRLQFTQSVISCPIRKQTKMLRPKVFPFNNSLWYPSIHTTTYAAIITKQRYTRGVS